MRWLLSSLTWAGVTVAVIVRAALDAADEPLAVVIDLRISLLKPFPFDPPARQ